MKNNNIVSLKSSPLDDIRNNLINMGIPYFYCRFREISYSKFFKRLYNPILILIDFYSSGEPFQIQENKTTYLKNSSFYFKEKKEIFIMPRKGKDPLSIFKSIRSKFFRQMLQNNVNWYGCNKIMPNNKDIMWEIDSNSKWPAWLYLYAKNKVDLLGDNIMNENKLLSEIKSYYGIHSKTKGLFPCLAFRMFQEIIRIDQNRIRYSPEGESLFLSFETGYLGWGYINNNLKVKYLLKTVGEKIIGEDILPISDQEIKDGIIIKPSTTSENEKKIYYASVELYLKDFLLDWSSGYYVREIKIKTEVIE